MTAALARLGRYELLGRLATGGMAKIHLARLAGEAGFEKIVVVKRLLPELVTSPAYVAMFVDEGKLVARLDHPNICEVHELGRDGAEYFLAMPYLDGVAATELIAQPRDPDRTLQLRVAAGVIVQACAGLHLAHELRDAAGAARARAPTCRRRTCS
jgi:serine/threonine-protein kinase